MSRTALCAALVSLGLVAGSTAGRAQGLAVGVEGGATFSTVHLGQSPTGVDLSNRTGLRMSGVLRYGFAGPFGLQTGLSLTQKGADLTDTSGSGLTESIHVNYVQVPLLLTLQIPTGPSPVHPRLFAGPEVGFQSKCTITGSASGISASVDCNSTTLGQAALDTKKTTFGLTFGGGLDFPIGGPLAITVDGRYELGLTDINNQNTSGNDSVKNRTFAVSGGLLVSLP